MPPKRSTMMPRLNVTTIGSYASQGPCEQSLSQFSVARKLGETIYDITPYRYEIQHRHVFHLHVHEPTERRWPSQELHDGQQPPTRLECFWIPLRDAHVLQAGQGALIGAIFEE
jgi:hypothetical protein